MSTEKKDLYDPAKDTISAGDTVVSIRNTQLACAMLAVGIPLRQDPPYSHIKRADGTDIWTFNFFPTDQQGEVTAHECIDAWSKDLDFMTEFPLHPFSFAMAAVKNMASFHEHMTEIDPLAQIPYTVPAENGQATLLVKEGTAKHKAAERRGFRKL
tara:strand:- start:315 stop:782 length:468 start_codon:yes stop_codon:yes gene_type:complete